MVKGGKTTNQKHHESKKKRHDNAFKARVALEALKGIKNLQEIGQEYEIHPMQVDKRKKKFEEMDSVFERPGKKRGQEDFEKEREKLHLKIGQLTIELDFMTKKSKQRSPQRLDCQVTGLSVIMLTCVTF